MAHRGGLKEPQAGHYYATVDGVLYQVLRARQAVPPRIVWDLYQVVDGDEEFLERAATLGCHRRTLDALAGGAGKAPRRPAVVPVSREVMHWSDLADALSIAAQQARSIELPVVEQALGDTMPVLDRALAIALRVVSRRLGTVPPAATPPAGDAGDDNYDRLLALIVSLEIARDQARWIGAGAEVVAREMVVAIQAMTRLSDRVRDAIVEGEATLEGDELALDAPEILEVAQR